METLVSPTRSLSKRSSVERPEVYLQRESSSDIAVTLLSTSDLNGGAAQAVLALHKGLRSRGIHSKMVVASKETQLPTISKVEPLCTTLAQRAGRRLAANSRRLMEEVGVITQAPAKQRFSYVSHPSSSYRKLAGSLGQPTVIQLELGRRVPGLEIVLSFQALDSAGVAVSGYESHDRWLPLRS